MEDAPLLKRKSRLAAVLLSLYQPGFGHFYARRPRRAVALLVISWAIAFAFFYGVIGRSFPTLLLTLALIAVVLLFSVLDAPRQASIPRAGNPVYARWYLVLPMAVAFQIVLLALLPQVQRLRSFYIPSASMEPTLIVNDRLVALVNREAAPTRNDLVIFHAPDDPSSLRVDRVVGLPGDIIELRDKRLFVNGSAAKEPWVVHRDPQIASAEHFVPSLRQRDQLAPTLVPEGYIFVMGDNRDLSYDSRFVGPVPLANVLAEPLYIYWSPDRSRIGTRLDRE